MCGDDRDDGRRRRRRQSATATRHARRHMHTRIRSHAHCTHATARTHAHACLWLKCAFSSDPVWPGRLKCAVSSDPVWPGRLKCAFSSNPVGPGRLKCAFPHDSPRSARGSPRSVTRWEPPIPPRTGHSDQRRAHHFPTSDEHTCTCTVQALEHSSREPRVLARLFVKYRIDFSAATCSIGRG